MATVKLKEIATDITWGDATRDINENNRKIQVALATVAAAGEGNAAWGESTTESAELIIGGSGTKVVSLEGHTHETSEVNGLDAKLAQTDASIDSLKSSDTAIKGQISGVNASISDLYNKVQDVDEGGVKKTDLKTLTVNVNGTRVGEYDTKADKTINITADMLGLSGAMTFVGVTITAISQGSTQNEIDLDDSTTYTAKKGDVVIYGNKEFVWVGSKWQELGDEQSFALKSVTVTGTGYLTGGGTLEANRTIDIATSVKTKIDNGDAALTKANALETNLANNYPTKNGTGASGTWGIDISGKAASADKVANALTFNSSGSGAASGSTYDGSGAKTISYNTIGAAKAVHSHAFGDITGKPTTLDGYGITDGVSDAELSAHANNTNIHLAEGDRGNIEAALVMASDVSSELTVLLEGYDTTPTLSTELGKKADASTLTAHTGNTTVHITAQERSSWNAKYSKPATGIPVDDMEAGVAESLANADLALADVGALSQNFINHEGDTTVHITASERTAWNAKANASTLNSHTGNTTIHTTAEEKASWNGKYTKPETGIPAEDLSDDVNASINTGAMSYEMASEASGKVTALLVSYGDTIPDLKTELGKKADVSDLTVHTGNTEIHTTSAEKASWNNKAEKAALNAHISDTGVHIQEGERESWNGKYEKPSTGIPKTDLAGDVQTEINKVNTAITTAGEAKQAVTTHTKDSVIHITADERTAWNGKANASALNAHTGNTTIHLAEGDRANIEAALAMASDASSELAAVLEGYETTPVLKNELGKKQDKLVSGTSIKTVNGASLLGSGNITTPKTTVVDNLTSTSVTDALSANQGKVLNEKFTNVVTQADVVNSLGSTEQKKPLSAFMGKVLSDRLTNGDFIAKEAKMQWGGANNNEGNFSPIESMLTESANRLTFGNAEGVTVEYSTDGGSTWNAYTEETDYGKLLHPIYSGTFCLGGSKATDRATTLNDMLRITINAKGIGRYLGGIRKMLIYGSTRNASSLNVVLEKRTAISGVAGGGDNAFVQAGILTFKGWPAWGAISLEDNYFGTWLNSETYNNGSVIEYRLTFSINKVSYTTYGAPFIQLVKLHSLTVYEANEFISRYGSSVLLMSDGMIHSDREFYLTKRVQAQNIQVSNLNVLSSMTIKPSITVEGVLTVNSKIAGGGNIEASGQLIIDGDATLKSNATVSGDLTVGGTLNYTRARIETSEASVTLDASKYTVINCSGDLTINLPNGYATDGKEYVCEVRTGSIAPTVSFPADIKFAFGENFVSGFEPNSVYQISIQNSLAVVIPFV